MCSVRDVHDRILMHLERMLLITMSAGALASWAFEQLITLANGRQTHSEKVALCWTAEALEL